MTRTSCIAILVVCLAIAVASAGLAQGEAELASQDQRASYSIGLDFGRTLAARGVSTDLDALMRGLRDGLDGADPALSDDDMRVAMETLNRQMQERAQAAAARNKEEGTAFLARNGKRDGVETTASGLQYEVLEAGDGPKPKLTDSVRVHYEGRLLDDSVFDSSIRRGQPAVFPVNRVIAGWSEALQLMPVGSKWRIFVPSELAYGEQGVGTIGANATLVFDVELIAIEQ